MYKFYTFKVIIIIPSQTPPPPKYLYSYQRPPGAPARSHTPLHRCGRPLAGPARRPGALPNHNYCIAEGGSLPSLNFENFENWYSTLDFLGLPAKILCVPAESARLSRPKLVRRPLRPRIPSALSTERFQFDFGPIPMSGTGLGLAPSSPSKICTARTLENQWTVVGDVARGGKCAFGATRIPQNFSCGLPPAAAQAARPGAGLRPGPPKKCPWRQRGRD